jgi:hypothetical protein
MRWLVDLKGSSVLAAPSQRWKNPWTKEKRKKKQGRSIIAQRHEPSQTEPNRTEPWYFRKPTLNGRAMYAFQVNKNKDKSKDVTQSTEPEPNKTPLVHTRSENQVKRKNIFESLET